MLRRLSLWLAVPVLVVLALAGHLALTAAQTAQPLSDNGIRAQMGAARAGVAHVALRQDPQQAGYVPGRLLVKLAENRIAGKGSGDRLKQRANARTRAHRATLALDGFTLRSISTANSLGVYSVEVKPGSEQEALAQLQKHPDVEYVELDYVYHAFVEPNDPAYGTRQWNLRQINAPQGWDTTTGSQDVIIAVVDTGVDLTHPDLADKIVPGRNIAYGTNDPSDDQGHGTHVASTAASTGNNGIGIAGVDWNARIMPVKVLDSWGSGSSSDVAAGIEWAVNNGADVINLSLGGSSPSTTIRNAVNYAYANGVFVVAAAGNSYEEGNPTNYPAAYDNVLAVAASDHNDGHAPYSNTGSYVDVAAPGGDGNGSGPEHWIYAAYWRGSGDEYAGLVGTSMATPHVAGLAALLLSLDRSLTPSQLHDIITSTAVDVLAPGRDDFSGHGRIDVAAAVAALGSIPPTPTGPTPTHTATPTPTPTRDFSISGIRNGDFEQGPNGDWTEYSVHFGGQGSLIWDQSALPSLISPLSGSYVAWLGGENDEISELSQVFTVSNSGSPLTFSYRIFSEDACGYDEATVSIDGAVLTTYDLCESNNTNGWMPVTLDLSAYAGQTVTLLFRVETDDSLYSNFFVEDIFAEGQSAPGATPTSTPTPTPTPVPGSSALRNGDFEAGPNGDWTEYSVHFGGQGSLIWDQSDLPSLISPRSGSYVAWLGGEYDEVSHLSQSVNIAPGTPPLTFFYEILSDDLCGYDSATILVNDQIVQSYDLCSDTETGGWTQGSVDLSTYAGQTVEVHFHVETDFSGLSSFFIDDVYLAAAAPAPTATSTATAIPTAMPTQSVLNVDAIDPAEALDNQSTTVTIAGTGFQATPAVKLGSHVLDNVTFVSSTQLQAVVPAGVPLGTYDLIVTNQNGDVAILAGAFTVRSSLARIDDVRPNQGQASVANTINVYGRNFTSGAIVSLDQQALDTTFVSDTHLRAVVSAGLQPRTYDIVVANTGRTDALLQDGYTVLEGGNDDLSSHGDQIWTEPVAPRAGEPVHVGLVVDRQGGKQVLTNVVVRFYEGDPNDGGTLLGEGRIDLLSPRSSASTSKVPWTPAAPGSYMLYTVIDPDGAVAESSEANNVVSRDLTVLPPAADELAPHVDSFTVNGGVDHTETHSVTLDALASDPEPGSGVKSLFFQEYEYSQGAGQWVPVQNSGWLDYETARVQYTWGMLPTAGVKYLQAWAADRAGNISLFPFKAFVNYGPPTDSVGTDEGRIYRYQLEQGDQLIAELDPTSGDPDLYIWPPDSDTRPPRVSNLAGDAIDDISWTAPVAGTYQIEVYGYATAEYRLSVQVVKTGQAQAYAPRGGIDPEKPERSQPLVNPGSAPGDQHGLPTAPSTNITPDPQGSGNKLYLPFTTR